MIVKAWALFISILCVVYADELSDPLCGSTARSTGTIVYGGSFKRGDYPWIVALFYTGDSPPSYFCGGTLVSSKHVITAAHCIKPKYGTAFFEQLQPENILALFGAFNLTNFYETERVALSPEKIIIHNEWNSIIERFDADIAILQFAGISFSRFIQPVCLSLSSLSVASIKEGTVAGWGRSEDETQNHQTVPKVLTLPMHTNEKCFLKTPLLAGISSERTFCAGLNNGSGICLGDSGSGFFVISSGVAHLRGVVSSSRTTPTSCDVTAYAVYTDVLKYKDWINGIIEGNLPKGPQSVPLHKEEAENVMATVPPSKMAEIGTKFECGIPEYKARTRSKRIISPIGAVVRGQFPWLAAIYTSDSEHQGFLCSGTLLSLKIVATAAHCLHKKYGRKSKVETLTVFVGKTNLRELTETGYLKSRVTAIEIHPDWNAFNENFDSDIAVVVLTKTISPSKFIKPICLWSSTISFDDLVETEGVVVGWGVTSKESQAYSFEQPKWTKLKVVTQEACDLSNLDVRSFDSSKTFCAGDVASKTGPCLGDYGGGFFVENSSKWYFRGIISANLHSDANCDGSSFQIYTDVAKFTDWLSELISKHG